MKSANLLIPTLKLFIPHIKVKLLIIKHHYMFVIKHFLISINQHLLLNISKILIKKKSHEII